MKKKAYIIFTLILTMLIGVISCNNENESLENEINTSFEYTYEFAEVKFNDLDLNINKNKSSKSKKNVEFTIGTKFKTNLKIPKDILESKDTDLFREFLTENEKDLKGEIIFLINGKKDKVFKLGDNTSIESVQKKQDDYPRRNECSYEGVRQCTQYSIYEEMNTFDKLFCAYAGLGCIAQEAGSCISKNCLGDTK